MNKSALPPIGRRLLAGALFAVLLAGCAGTAPVAATASERGALAPSGSLRVGVYRGSPSSYVAGAQGDAPRGVGYLLGQAFAQRLGVPFEPVVFAANAELLAAVRQGQVDIVFTNATAERARFIDFSPTVLDVQKSVLVPAASPITSLEALRGCAARIGVSAGSSTGAELAPLYPAALLQPVPDLRQAATLLAQGGLDGFATNNAILFELADQVPGSRVLPGSWGLEHFALGVPQGRGAGRDLLARFARESAQSGLLRRAVEQSRLRGTVAP